MALFPVGRIATAKTGCSNARGEVLEAFRGYLKTLARAELHKNLSARADSSDLVQETFLRAHEGFATFRGNSEGELAAWLRSILASRLSKLHRTQSTQKRNHELERQLNESSVLIGQSLVHPGPSPSEVVSKQEWDVIIANAIERLPADYRTVILLRHIRQLPHAEVAREMQRTVDSVKKLWVRALAQLKRAVEARA